MSTKIEVIIDVTRQSRPGRGGYYSTHKVKEERLGGVDEAAERVPALLRQAWAKLKEDEQVLCERVSIIREVKHG